jgi:hypothetical protein
LPQKIRTRFGEPHEAASFVSPTMGGACSAQVQAQNEHAEYQREGSEIQKTMLAGLMSEKRVSINLEEPGLLFSSRFPEGVIRLTDLNVYEPGFCQHCSPAFARKATGNSSSPKVDIAYRALRHRLTIGDIAEL